MKTIFDLPDELIREVKLRAVTQRRKVKDLVAEFLRQGLGMTPSMPPQPPPANYMVEIGIKDLPIIKRQAKAHAKRMSARKLFELEPAAQAEEDLKHAGLPV